MATASDMPPTSALAMEAVPCGLSAVHSGAYHSSAMRPRRITIRPVVRRAAKLVRHASSLAGSSPASAIEIVFQSFDWPQSNPAQTANSTARFNRMTYSVRFADREWRSPAEFRFKPTCGRSRMCGVGVLYETKPISDSADSFCIAARSFWSFANWEIAL
jgi:hypothetical protein